VSAPAGDFDYESGGNGYAAQRRADPRIEAILHAALGSARTVVNVGAGAGSYEPRDRWVVAVEPSAAMRAQRPTESAPVVGAVAERLPFRDNSVDAALATYSVHQWRDGVAGLREMRRVSSGPVVIMTSDGDALEQFWLADYAPELIAAERRRYPAIEDIRATLGGRSSVEALPIPIDCHDGFTEAYYARPEAFLDPAVRRSQSAWGFVDDVAAERAVGRLRDHLESGEWDRRYGALRELPTYVGSLRIITALPAAADR